MILKVQAPKGTQSSAAKMIRDATDGTGFTQERRGNTYHYEVSSHHTEADLNQLRHKLNGIGGVRATIDHSA